MKTILYPSLVVVALTLGAFSQKVQAAEPTAFDLIKQGDKYVGEQAKDKIVQIRSERSVGGLMPTVWYVVYYDPTATLKATEVKFGAGKMLDVKRPLRLLEPVTGENKPLDSSKLKIDSDKALSIAQKEPMLKKVELKSTQFWLEHGDTGPVWKIRFWAAKQDRPGAAAGIGELYIAADTGDVVKSDLHLDHVY